MVQWSKLFGFDGVIDSHRIAEEARRCMYLSFPIAQLHANYQRVIPLSEEESLPSTFDPAEVTKVALRLRYLIEECVPCELEEEKITRPHSKIITEKVLKAAKEAGGEEYSACVVYCLLVAKRWFKHQAVIEIWDADLHNIRSVAAEVIAKHL